MNAYGSAFLWSAIHITLLSVPLLLLYAVARRYGPRAGFLVTLTGVVQVLVLTALAFSPWPRWNWTTPAWAAPLTAHVAPSAPLNLGFDQAADDVAQSPVTDSRSAESATVTTSHESAEAVSPIPAAAVPWEKWLVVALLTGQGIALARLVAGGIAVRRYVRSSRPIHSRQLYEIYDVLAAEFAFTRPIELRESPRLATAATVGSRRPVILLPSEWTSWSPQERRAVLAHEIAHVVQDDFFAAIVAQFTVALHFYHPAVHWLASRIRLDQELAADARAALLVGGRRPYLKTLAELAIRQDDRAVAAPARMFLPTHGTFLRRISMLRNPRSVSLSVPRSLQAATLLGLSAAALLVSGIRRPVAAEGIPAVIVPAEEIPLDSFDVEPPTLPRETLVAQAETPATGKSSEYQNATEAWNLGVTFYNSRNYAAARKPLEAALRLTEDPARKLRIQRALMSCYRQLESIEPMIGAVEYVIEHSESDAEKSIVRRSYLSFIHERGKTQDIVARYEKQLDESPNDRVALYLLSEVYSRLTNQPAKSAALIDRLASLQGQDGKPMDVRTSANLASQYVRARQYQKGAELYEKIAEADASLEAWHWKEAATAWLKLGNKDKARDAALKSSAAPPEKRSEQLTHYWHRNVADVLLAVGEPAKAIPHYESAIESTNIDGYIKGCQASLAEARAAVGQATADE